MSLRIGSFTLCLLWLVTAANAHEGELYRAWRDPVNTRELSVQTAGMVLLMLGILAWRKWGRHSR